MRRAATIILAAGLLAAVATTGWANTVYVNGSTGDDAWDGHCAVWDGGGCGPLKTIQAGIAAAATSDIVVVADGTYAGAGNVNLDFGGKAITVRSENGAEHCAIDCAGSGRGFYFHSSETAASVVEGFTIRNGAGAPNGGAMYIGSAAPTVRRCIFRENQADYGGGVFADHAQPTLIECTFDHNTASASAGGMYNLNYPGAPSATLLKCTFAENSAESAGGAIRNWDSSPTIRGCVFYYNHARYIGAGMANGGASHPAVTNCVFDANRADTLFANWDCFGGGMCNTDTSSPVLTNCVFTGNASVALFPYLSRGGAMANGGSASPTLVNCTLTGNYADIGDALSNIDSSHATVRSCILWNGGDEFANEGSATVAVTYSTVQGSWAGTGNDDDNPLLVDPLHGDFRLQAGSPCIDTGDPALAPAPGATDLYGLKRVWDGDEDETARVDMGAAEFGSFVYGDLNCDGALDNFDINPFVLVLTDTPPAYEAYYAQFPDCDALLADANYDGALDNFDINPFVGLLIGG